MTLADQLIKKGVLKNPRLIEAFRKVDRKDFLPEDLKDFAYVDEPLPIGEGQTISQPWTVAFMLELLDPKPGENIMEIGYGSGWQTALLAVTGANVYAIERVENLCKLGKENVENFFKKEITQGESYFFCQDGTLGLSEIAKKIGGFDKIIVGASGKELPQTWKDQLKIDGKIIAPVGHSIFVFIKEPGGSFKNIEHPGFAFVPLISDKK